ncbi:bifunctional diguanylate cyclase/phosphodiesterase [Pseudoalteromonas sp. MMG013]|uniref:putative bifunctional diguanylate cyclase/phosphodiesterase n=1 Tax=Pseudoalteromonas sp. MMG013 TaxID=2822687 RepID=UPI001B35A9C7|nr:bifunctional diguanylate cyclase/phosphodiesterase [Pseudoalteromonas sp. MMG013]MBQ4860238.1 bifunctional diguanylate cyclase/phosphodiesterase [Pseudoalteromonas sp. MMG013]
MSKTLKVLSFLAVSTFLFGYVFNILFSKTCVDARLGFNNISLVEIAEHSSSEMPTPWYQLFIFGQQFFTYQDDTFVLLDKHNDNLILAKNSELLTTTLLSPTALVSFCMLIFTLIYLFRAERKKYRHNIALNLVRTDVTKLLESLDIKTQILQHGGLLAQISHAVHVIADNVDRIKLQTDSNLYQDKLTQLIDRHAYLEHLDIQLTEAEKKHQHCGLLFIDLDGFKQVNDSFGHSFGDEILIQVANRLSSIVKQYDIQDIHPIHGLEQNLSRLGGDEFSIFIPKIEDASFCTRVSQTILNEIERDFVLGNKIVKIGASIGIAIYPESASHPHALLQMADVAMYRAKTDGRGIFKVYSPEMGSKIRRYHYLLEELRLAIASQNFHLSFQPIVHVEDCAIDYFEALIRWHHPIEGLIPPAEFIPIAEESNLILELGDWILLESCRQMSAWHNAGMKKVKISVNVSGIQLKHRPIAKWVEQTLEKTGLPASSLMLEITESTLITASEEIIEQLEACRRAGVTIAIDDFGTGFSSLSTLADLPIDVIKIDKLFITQASQNQKYHKILNSISELGNQLGLKIVAEGVEQAEQFELVKSMGIRCVQGYLVSRPETSHNVGTKVLKGNVNHIASTGTSIWLPDSK